MKSSEFIKEAFVGQASPVPQKKPKTISPREQARKKIEVLAKKKS